jgi:hypothetical protein
MARLSESSLRRKLIRNHEMRRFGSNAIPRQGWVFAFTNRALLTPFVMKLGVRELGMARSCLASCSSSCWCMAL